MIEGGQSITGVMRAAQDAADEIGSGDTTAIASGCDLIRIGVFFDGTGNFRQMANVAGRPWHTNPDLLQEVYRDTPGSNVAMIIAGEERRVAFGSLYMRGIGVGPSGTRWAPGMGLGIGGEGVFSRVGEAINEANALIRERSRGLVPCQVWVDTFGFSRGAAAARNFGNRRSGLSGGNAEVSIKFLGLFDCVSSIGWPGNAGSAPQVDISTRASNVERTVHLTADDEFRKNFPLTLANGEVRIRLVGAHSDIGGGYQPGTERGRLQWFEFSHPHLADFIKPRWRLNGRQSNTAGDSLHVVPPDPYNPYSLGTLYEFRWNASFGLQMVAIHLMHDQAAAAGVPLDPLPTGGRYALSGVLAEYLAAMRSPGASVPQDMIYQVRINYAHISASNDLAHSPTTESARTVRLH